MRATAIGLAETLFVGIPSPLWFFLWEGTLHTDSVYKQAFLDLYHLEIVTIEGTEGLYEAVSPRDGYLAWWVSMSLFILTPDAACLVGCQQTKFY